MRILATAFDYRPRLGGIATLSFELLREMGEIPGCEIKLLAPKQKGSEIFDQNTPIETKRISVSHQIPLAVLQMAFCLRKERVAWKPDAVLNLLWIPDGISSLLSSSRRGVPYFVFGYGVELLESEYNFKKKIRKTFSPLKYSVFKKASKIFAISHFTKNLLVEHCNVSPNQVVFAYPGVDPSRFYPAPRAEDLVRIYGLEGKTVLLTITRLDPYKGIDQAILSLKEVVKKIPNLIYLVCGTGKDTQRLNGLIIENQLQDYVKMVGEIPFERLRDYYNLADLYVMLSREHKEPPDVEGFGIVFLEAAACGVPSLGGRSGGVSDAIEDRQSGWLVDPLEAAEIAALLIEILGQPSLLKEKGKFARERALECFDWKQMAQSVYHTIRESVD